MSRNPILAVDSYKCSHFLAYPPATKSMYCYLESRGGKFDTTTFFGLQYILDEYLSKPITQADIDEADEVLTAHGVPFNRAGWQRILEVHKGFLPVRIRAVKEGTRVPVHNVLMTVESTDPEFFWVAGYIETLLMRVWYPTTVATLSNHVRKLIYSYLEATSDDPAAEIDFKFHDFGARGVSSGESAAIGDAAHLVSFKGTDTIEGIMLCRKHYDEPMAGFSIPAAEHSTVTSWGKEGERASYENMLDQFAKPGKIVAVVSDSYDLWNAIDNIWGKELKQKILESDATLVVRPDSGDPIYVVCETLRRLDRAFGHTINSKGYKVLGKDRPGSIKVIQGDGIDYESLREILRAVQDAGYSASNMAYGSGGGLLQKVDRDTQKFAYKCSEITREVEGREACVPVFKDPKTDPGKRSKSGKLDLVLTKDGQYKTVDRSDRSTEENQLNSALIDVYANGELFNRQSLSDIRARAAK